MLFRTVRQSGRSCFPNQSSWQTFKNELRQLRLWSSLRYKRATPEMIKVDELSGSKKNSKQNPVTFNMLPTIQGECKFGQAALP